MARVTVEDCIDKVDNRFELVLLASHRARQISPGRADHRRRATTTRTRSWRCARSPTRRCRPDDLKEDLIHSLQKHVEVDEPEADGAGDRRSDRHRRCGDRADDAEDNIAFDRMTEEELLAGIEGLVPPEKSDDY